MKRDKTTKGPLKLRQASARKYLNSPRKKTQKPITGLSERALFEQKKEKWSKWKYILQVLHLFF